MAYAATVIENKTLCTNCRSEIEPQGKFCGHCGFVSATWEQVIEETAPAASLPSFATAGIPVESAKTTELITQANRLMLHLARERLFLYMHWIIFLGINFFGFWTAWRCYADFHGDEMSKMVMALTPFLFINSLALLCLVPIKGTRSQIALLKERISYIRFNIEFAHLNFRDRR